MFVPEVAEQFQLLGITAVIYDPRSIGVSDGTPRNEIDPMKQVEDYSDALTFLSTLPMVDSDRIGFWGMSFSGTIALCAAALDKRAKFVIAICPLLSFEYSKDRFPKVLAKAAKDRESQIKGNPPFYLPLLTEKGENPAGFGIGMDKEGFEYISTAKERVAPSFENRTTIQSYYKVVMWQPSGLMRYVSPTPVMFVVPELDKVSPPEDQIALFKTFAEPKRLHISLGKGHLNVLSGEDFPSTMKLQASWAVAALEGTLDMQ
jgi:fermentation-respiration switch protein FrsA (DUF1100 family)